MSDSVIVNLIGNQPGQFQPLKMNTWQACAQMHLHLQMQVQMRHLHLHLHLIHSRRMHLHLHLHLIHPHLHLHLHLIQMHLIESNANQMRIKCEPSEITPECS